eukprot:1371325-Rhodomonas_salina.2
MWLARASGRVCSSTDAELALHGDCQCSTGASPPSPVGCARASPSLKLPACLALRVGECSLKCQPLSPSPSLATGRLGAIPGAMNMATPWRVNQARCSQAFKFKLGPALARRNTVTLPVPSGQLEINRPIISLSVLTA